MTMRRAATLLFACGLLVSSVWTGTPAAATDENLYVHKWPNGVFQSLRYATGNISYFNGAGEALSLVQFGPNTINAMPDNDMVMWYAGSDCVTRQLHGTTFGGLRQLDGTAAAPGRWDRLWGSTGVGAGDGQLTAVVSVGPKGGACGVPGGPCVRGP